MSKELDRKYHELALTALHSGLPHHEIIGEHICSKKEILNAFDYSGNILRNNHNDEQVHMWADTVFETCIRLTRCLFFPEEARTIVLQGKNYTLEKHSQLESLRRNIDELKRIIED